MSYAAAEASEHLNQIFSVAVENFLGVATYSSLKLKALAFALHMESASMAAIALRHNTAQAGGQSDGKHRSASAESVQQTGPYLLPSLPSLA